MKKILVLVVSVVTLSSCLNKGDDTPPLYQYWGVVKIDKSLDLGYKLLLDNKQEVIPVVSDYKYAEKERDRMCVYFNLEEGSTKDDSTMYATMRFADLYSIQNVIRQADTIGLDTLGVDPLGVINGSIWVTNNLMNVAAFFDGAKSQGKKHTFNLVYFPDSVATEEGGVYMELRHNANEDRNEATYNVYKCFDLNSIDVFKNEADSIPYTIKVNAGKFDGAANTFEGMYYKPDVIR